MSRNDLEQLRAELAVKAAEVIGTVLPHTPDLDALSAQVVAAITDGWRATKNTDYFRDTEGHILNGSNLLQHGPGAGDPSEHTDMVFWEIGTAPRELTADERTEREAQEARSSWVYGDHSTPPPVGVRLGDLLRQSGWWITKDRQVLRLEDMAPTHRANTLAMLRRGAVKIHESETWRWMTGAPDDVVDSAIAETSGTPEERQARAWKWLRKQPLVKRLRELVKADRLMAGTAEVG